MRRQLGQLFLSVHVGLMWHKLPPWVLEQLFTWVKHNTDVSSKNGELTRLARVCKSWSLVALNLLWTRCDDLTCLMFTLPMDVLQPSPETGVLVRQVLPPGICLTIFTGADQSTRSRRA